MHFRTYEKYLVHPYWQCKIVDLTTLFNYQGKGCWVKKKIRNNMKTHSKVRHVLCLPIVLQHLPFCNNYCHVETIMFCKLKRRTKMLHIIITCYLQTFYKCALSYITPTNLLQLLPTVCNSSLPFANLESSGYFFAIPF